MLEVWKIYKREETGLANFIALNSTDKNDSVNTRAMKAKNIEIIRLTLVSGKNNLSRTNKFQILIIKLHNTRTLTVIYISVLDLTTQLNKYLCYKILLFSISFPYISKQQLKSKK